MVFGKGMMIARTHISNHKYVTYKITSYVYMQSNIKYVEQGPYKNVPLLEKSFTSGE